MKCIAHFCAAVLFCGCLFSSAALRAASAQEIKQNMKARTPLIAAMMEKGSVGEANTGYLVARETLSDEEKKTVDAENKDRRTIYEAIAKQQKTTAELVGQRRAKQISERARPGAWYQGADGSWTRK